MKKYPIISNKKIYNIPVAIFPKWDGSNIRFEYSSKRGFYKYGSRKQLIPSNSSILAESIEIFNNKYSEKLSEYFKEKKIERAVCFGEFFGPTSEFGKHVKEKHDLMLFDINLYKVGILGPLDFCKIMEVCGFSNTCIYTGNYTLNIDNDIMNGIFPGQTFEGVVCKTLKLSCWLLLKVIVLGC